MPTEDQEGRDGAVVVSAADYLWFVDRALGRMAAILQELGDDLGNRRPPLRNARSPYALLTRCLGVVEFWGGGAVAERPVQRDRAGESSAVGDVASLLRRTEQARRRLREDIVGLDPTARPAEVTPNRPDVRAVPYARSKGAVLVHIVEELFQHLGQMEVTRDALVTGLRR